MIIVQFSGGLGNQLSQYALYLEYKTRGLDARADLSWYGSAQPKTEGVDTRKLELPLLGIEPGKELITCPTGYEYYGHEGGLGRYVRRIMVGPAYFEQGYKFTPQLLDVKKGYVMGGCFLGEQYIPTCEALLRQKIRFTASDSDYIRSMKEKIESVNAVSIHMRLGDYLNNDSLYGGICTPSYYKKAVETIRAKTDNPVFFLFSNDVVKAQELLGIDGVIPVEGNTGDRSYLDMYLMSLCRHNIIANSTFSWWGAWLNGHEDKIVCCPETLLNGYDNGIVYCKDWIRVPS